MAFRFCNGIFEQVNDLTSKRAVPQTQATMTEQEANVFAKRLVRIWRPEKVHRSERFSVGEPEEGFTFSAQLTPLTLTLHISCNAEGFYSRLNSAQVGSRGQLFFLRGDVFDSLLPDATDEKRAQQAQFTAQWLPFFRRGCWLAGLPLEATAHEKTEWIQGFSQEEIEAWNLKM